MLKHGLPQLLKSRERSLPGSRTRLKTPTAPRLTRSSAARVDAAALEEHVPLRHDQLHRNLPLHVDLLRHRWARRADIDERRRQRAAGNARGRERQGRVEHQVGRALAEAGSASSRTSHDERHPEDARASWLDRLDATSAMPAFRNSAAAHSMVRVAEGNPAMRPHICLEPCSSWARESVANWTIRSRSALMRAASRSGAAGSFAGLATGRGGRCPTRTAGASPAFGGRRRPSHGPAAFGSRADSCPHTTADTHSAAASTHPRCDRYMSPHLTAVSAAGSSRRPGGPARQGGAW